MWKRIDETCAGRTEKVKRRAGRAAPSSGRIRGEKPMSNLASWISPEVLRTLGWTLLHFLWQGAGLAALFAVAAAVCRSASASYALAAGRLRLVSELPAGHFTLLAPPRL